jgi:hypothetical protein
VINFVALHISEFYSTICEYPTTRRIAAVVQARNLLPLLSCFAQSSFQSGVEITPNLRHTLIAILAKER